MALYNFDYQLKIVLYDTLKLLRMQWILWTQRILRVWFLETMNKRRHGRKEVNNAGLILNSLNNSYNLLVRTQWLISPNILFGTASIVNQIPPAWRWTKYSVVDDISYQDFSTLFRSMYIILPSHNFLLFFTPRIPQGLLDFRRQNWASHGMFIHLTIKKGRVMIHLYWCLRGWLPI